jgi:hypothetical protein
MDARAPELAWGASKAGGRRRWAEDMFRVVEAACMLEGLWQKN